MSKKNQTKKGKEKQAPESELLYDKYYLIDEKKCLYGLSLIHISEPTRPY